MNRLVLPCRECDGRGGFYSQHGGVTAPEPAIARWDCPECGGSGEMGVVFGGECVADGEPCRVCGGAAYGEIEGKPGTEVECPECGGTGEAAARVDIPGRDPRVAREQPARRAG